MTEEIEMPEGTEREAALDEIDGAVANASSAPADSALLGPRAPFRRL